MPARVLHKQNGGLASARNVGLAAARGRILLFVNDDTLAFPDLVREHLRAHAELAARGLEASVLGTFEQPNAHLSSALMRHLEGSPEVFRYHDMRAGEFYDHNRFWTCNVSVPAARVREAGEFDERFKRYGCEDIDLGLRLERAGLRVLYHPGARAHHEHVLDFDALRRRQLSCSASFVHLFAKHPSELDHPDWAWLAGRSADSMRSELRACAERCTELEAALATLARIELPALEALGERELTAQVLERLAALLRELNALWWQTGLAQGLGEVGAASFAELRAREPQTAFGGLRGRELQLEHVRAQLALLHCEEGAGEKSLATLRAITLGCALQSAGAEGGPLLAQVRSELARLCPAPPALPSAPSGSAAFELARKSANLLRARVLWLDGEAPREELLSAGARSLTCAAELSGCADGALDVVIGSVPCARAELLEIARVLRPGGRWACSIDPYWWGACAPLRELPEYAQLLLDERELYWYLELVAGPARAAQLLEALRSANRMDAAELQLALIEAGFDCSALQPVAPPGGARLPAPALWRELARAHPGQSDFGTTALRGVLVRRGRTIRIGDRAAETAGA